MKPSKTESFLIELAAWFVLTALAWFVVSVLSGCSSYDPYAKAEKARAQTPYFASTGYGYSRSMGHDLPGREGRVLIQRMSWDEMKAKTQAEPRLWVPVMWPAGMPCPVTHYVFAWHGDTFTSKGSGNTYVDPWINHREIYIGVIRL